MNNSVRTLSTMPGPRVSRWFLVLVSVWLLLAVRIGFAVVRAEPLGDTMALPTVMFFVATALLGSRAWGALQRRRDG